MNLNHLLRDVNHHVHFFPDVSSLKILSNNQIDVSFKDIIGLEDEKRLLLETFQLPKKYPYLYTELGVLLYGKPGTGKTLLATGLAQETGSCYTYFSISDIIHGEIGKSQKTLKQVFQVCERLSPDILFIDELQSIFGDRSVLDSENISSKLSSQLGLEFDKVSHMSTMDKSFIVIGATNLKDKLDKALFLPSKFEMQSQIGLPDASGRELIIRRELSLSNLENVLEETDGFSPAETIGYCNQIKIRLLMKENLFS